jgi:hypothetical protein
MTKSKLVFKPSVDFMKYWRVIRYYVKAKYGITTADLDVLLFLYSEGYFNKQKFTEFNQVISWDKERFARLLRDGWISVFRTRRKNQTTLYEISFKGKRVVLHVYRILNGDTISENKSTNPLFLANTSYNDKVYRNLIIEMNKTIRQQQRLSRL